MQINVYLNFPGTCEEAFKFYAALLDGKIIAMMKPEGSPMETHTSPDQMGKIMHARMSVGGTLLMGSDTFGQSSKTPQGFSVNIGVETPEDADRIFAALAEGGTVGMAIQETFWAKRFGTCIDRFGTPWMVNCEKPMA